MKHHARLAAGAQVQTPARDKVEDFDDGGTPSTVVLQVVGGDEVLRVPVPGRRIPLSAS